LASPGGQRSASIAISIVRSRSQAPAASIFSCSAACSSMSLVISSGSSTVPSFSLTSLKRSSSFLVAPMPSTTFSNTVLPASSWGSCGNSPTVAPSATQASPAKSLSMPAMMRSSVDLPAPL
jgi:hypothetical protein